MTSNSERMTIVLGNEERFERLKKNSNGRVFKFFKKFEDAYVNHLQASCVDSYLISADEIGHGTSLNDVIKNIHLLNRVIIIVIFNAGRNELSRLMYRKNVYISDSIDEITSKLKSIPANLREYNRVKWPVSVIFWDENDSENKRKGLVLSLSAGGCLVFSENILEKDVSVALSISFKNFLFFVEGNVVRCTDMQFAVQFRDISIQTKKLIKRIIDDKILLSLKH